MSEIKSYQDKVNRILIEYPEARNSDNILYLLVCESVAGVDPHSMSFAYVMNNLTKLGLPQFETIRRTRQKIQHDNPDLKANKVVQKYRDERENDFLQYGMLG